MRLQSKIYQNCVHKFRQIPKNERTNYINKILAVEQSQQPPPTVFLKQFQSKSTFQYEGYKLNYFSVEKNNNPKAIVVHFHGLNSHGGLSGYYASEILAICPETNFYSFDQMNFGQSEGPCRGHISSLEDSANQGQSFIDFILKKLKNKPRVFLSGSSFGGTIIFKMALKSPDKYDGLILLVPALRDLQQSKPCLKRLAKFLGYVMPRVHLPSSQKSDSGTKYDISTIRVNDKHSIRDAVVPGTIAQVLYGMQSISNEYKNLKHPYILIQGGVEKMVDPFAPIDLEQLSPSQDKTTIYYENLWHAIFFEQQIEDISKRVGQWVRKRVI